MLKPKPKRAKSVKVKAWGVFRPGRRAPLCTGSWRDCQIVAEGRAFLTDPNYSHENEGAAECLTKNPITPTKEQQCYSLTTTTKPSNRSTSIV